MQKNEKEELLLKDNASKSYIVNKEHFPRDVDETQFPFEFDFQKFENKEFSNYFEESFSIQRLTKREVEKLSKIRREMNECLVSYLQFVNQANYTLKKEGEGSESEENESSEEEIVKEGVY